MILTIIVLTAIGILGYYLGRVDQTKRFNSKIEDLNNSLRIPNKNILPEDYDTFRLFVTEAEKLKIGNIMDLSFNYGFRECNEEQQKMEDDKVDKMLMELEKEHFTGNIRLSGGTE